MMDFLHSKPQQENGAPSNGHGRAEFGNLAMPRQSNLFVETNHPYTEQQLREMFIHDLKQCNKEYGYYVHTVSNGKTTNGFDDDRASSFNVYPIETYRIYADGRPDQLVRGVSFIGTPLSAFSNIKAAGGNVGVFNGACGARSGWVPVSAVSPMLYVSQMETQCLQESRSRRRTILSAPEFVSKEELRGLDTDSIVFCAMGDEMKRCMDSLKAEDGTKPYFIDYVIYRFAEDKIEPTRGGRGYGEVKGIKYKGKVSLVIGDKMRVRKNFGIELEDLAGKPVLHLEHSVARGLANRLLGALGGGLRLGFGLRRQGGSLFGGRFFARLRLGLRLRDDGGGLGVRLLHAVVLDLLQKLLQFFSHSTSKFEMTLYHNMVLVVTSADAIFLNFPPCAHKLVYAILFAHPKKGQSSRYGQEGEIRLMRPASRAETLVCAGKAPRAFLIVF